jgi:FkbH-like protein
MPACYTTCDLYERRKDGKCRRFIGGYGYVESEKSVLGFVGKVAFKRWGQLMAYANFDLVPADRARELERAAATLGRAIAKVPDSGLSILGRAGVSARLARRVKKQISQSRWWALEQGARPTSFMVEVFNPQKAVVNLSLVIRDADGELSAQPFQDLLKLEPGFNRVRVPFERIASHVDPHRTFHITLCPNLLEPEEEGLTLYFGLVSFVVEPPVETVAPALTPYEPAAAPEGKKHVKVVAWDLDNTLWTGILVEDGDGALRLKPGVLDVIQQLDRRGIVNSVVSKNDMSAVMPLLQRLGAAEYFVFPQVSWEPKSQAVKELIEAFNVGADTIAVIDDSAFERAEISERCPGVRVYAETVYTSMLEMPEFRPALSEESAKRREFYRTEERRVVEKTSFGGDYESFLRDCNIKVDVRRTTRETVPRSHEVIQRTNQLNFSGNRYTRDAVDELVQRPNVLPLSISCHDRFGEYGLVGFCLIDRTTETMTDLMFSCRVQAKRVEHAFLIAVMHWLRDQGATEFRALYTRTAKNVQAARVFDDLGFTLSECDAEKVKHVYSYDLRGALPTQDIISVTWNATP